MKTTSLLQASAALLAISSQILVGANDDSEFVTCGSAIKLSHRERSGNEYFLSSGGHRINSGSGQQLVTSSPHKADSSSTLWTVREGQGQEPCEPGVKIKFGTKIRLSHVDTGSNLHSHQVKSALSRQQEVTAFGEDGNGDHGDDWVVNPAQGSSNYWKKDNEVFIMHDQTKHHLGCSEQAVFSLNNCGRQCPVMDHLEVFARKEKDHFVKWKTSMGVFLHK